MRRLLVVVLVLFATFTSAVAVRAYDTWCADDPVVEVAGQQYDIQVSVPTALRQNVAMATVYVSVPVSGDAVVLKMDSQQFPERVVFVRDGGNPYETVVVAVTAQGVPVPARAVVTAQ